ncbi:MAG: peptide chain release factor 1, partial [bacterium]
PNDKKNAIVEIRAGTGGEEAALFAANLLSMYAKYTELQGLKFELLSTNETALGGYKEVIFSVEGPGSYGKMKFESGIHRVQRVPNTEASGRIHTSAVSAAVMPERDEVEVDISPDDIKVEVCKASGAGGQHVNTTESAVRIVHLPTGVEVQCQDERSQHKNKDKAMKILRSRVKDKMDSEEKTRADSERKAQVGTGDRSEKIRTYNFPQNRVTDHRIGLTSYNLESVMEGRLDEFIEKLTSDFNQKLMANE